MTDIRSLEQTLLDNLLQNKARIKFVARFLLALVSLRQNGVVAGFVMADAILPKGHRKQNFQKTSVIHLEKAALRASSKISQQGGRACSFGFRVFWWKGANYRSPVGGLNVGKCHTYIQRIAFA